MVGEVKGKTRADRLNEGLKRVCVFVWWTSGDRSNGWWRRGSSLVLVACMGRQSMASAIEAAKAAFAAQKGDSRKQSDDDDDHWQVEAEVKAATKSKKQLKIEPKADRFQQQKLSFATPVTNGKQRERSSEPTSRKRASLDSMSRRPPPTSPSSSLSDRRPRNEALLALRHKKPRPLSSPPRGRAPHDSPHRLATGGGKRPLTESKYFASDQQRKPQKKMELIKFVNHLEEKKASHATTLNEYLALAQKQTNAIHDFTRPRTASALDEISSSRSNGATAARKSKQEREQQRAKLRRQNAGISSWVKREKKNAPSTPPGPAKRQSLDQPRSAPDRHKSSLKGSNLSFVMASSAGGSSSGSSQSSSQAAKREKVRSSSDAYDDGDERHRKRKRSSDFSSPAQRPNKVRSVVGVGCGEDDNVAWC